MSTPHQQPQPQHVNPGYQQPPGGTATATAPPPGAPMGGYASPIPLKRTHLGHAIASEWTKIRSVRSTVWTLGIMFLLVIGIDLLTAMAISGGTFTGMPLLAPGLFGLMLGQICVITLGVLVITSEYGTGMVRTTMTACPKRGRVLVAKSLIFFTLAFVMTTVACSISALANSALLSDQKIPEFARNVEEFQSSIEGDRIVADSGQWLGATVGAGLYVALLGLLALAVGALLRHSAGAITTMLGFVLLPLVLALFMSGEKLKDVRDFLMEYSPLNGLASLFRIPMAADDPNTTGWPLLGNLAGVTDEAHVAAYAQLEKRDD
jgi:hypothetical protein